MLEAILTASFFMVKEALMRLGEVFSNRFRSQWCCMWVAEGPAMFKSVCSDLGEVFSSRVFIHKWFCMRVAEGPAGLKSVCSDLGEVFSNRVFVHKGVACELPKSQPV